MDIEQWYPEVEPFTNSIGDADDISVDQGLDQTENHEA